MLSGLAKSLPSFSDLIYLSVLLFLPTQLGKHLWPSFSYLYGIRIDYLSPTLYFTDILLLALFLSVIKIQMETFNGKKLALIPPLLRRQQFLMVGLTAILLGSIFSKNPILGMLEIFRLLEMIFFGWYTVSFLRREKGVQLFLATISLSLLFESVLAITQFILQHSLGSAFYFLGERDISPLTPGAAIASLDGVLRLRPYGTFSHPNILAGFLLVGGSVVYSFLSLFPQKKMIQLLSVLAIVAASFSLLFTFSRSALLLFFLLLFVFTVIPSRNRRRMLIIILLLVVLVMLLSPLLYARFTSPDLLGDSLQQRLFLITASMKMIYEHPYVGVGLSQFLPSLASQFPYLTFSLLQPVHNIYLLTASETGVVGVVGFLVALFSIIRRHILRYGATPLLLPLILCLLLGLTDHYLLTQQQGRLLFSLVIACAYFHPKPFAHRLRKNTQIP